MKKAESENLSAKSAADAALSSLLDACDIADERLRISSQSALTSAALFEADEPYDVEPRRLSDDEGFVELRRSQDALLDSVQDMVTAFREHIAASEEASKRTHSIAKASLGVAALSLALTAILLLREFGVL